jgi:maltooligosyltrehalose trehalohydrolase
MREIDVLKRSLGLSFQREQADIVLWAPHVQQAAVRLLNQEAEIPLTQAGYGYWVASTHLLKPGDRYQYVLDKKTLRPDPASVSQPDGPHGPSEALDLTHFSWTDQQWENLPLENYLLYELHTGTFSPEGNFQGIEARLDYLKELGVTAIEIMPVAQFPGKRNWGYDGVFPFAVQNSYGGARALQQLVNICHAKGLAVVLDVVYNHLGPEGNYLNDFGPYFTEKYNTPWGKAINFDDAWCDGVRRYFVENMLMWFRDFHIDALRLDAVHAIKDFSPKHILLEMRERLNQLITESGRSHYLIVECDLNDTRFINPPKEAGGFGMDAQWIDEFHHALRVSTGQETSGYYADFNGLQHLAKSYRDAYVYTGQYSPHRHKRFGTPTDKNPGKQFVVFSQNHDQVGNRMLGERSSQLVSFEMQKLMAGAVLMSPFLPMLFMGEEWAEPNPFLYFVSHTDPELVEAVRKGRKAEFAAFHAEGEAPDPQDENTFIHSKLSWDLLEKEPHHSMLRWYKELIRLRKQLPVLAQLNRQQLDVEVSEERQILLLHRWHEGHHLLAFMNFSDHLQHAKLPTYRQSWYKLLDSADPLYRGPKAAPPLVAAADTLHLQAASFILYTSQRYA